MLSLKKGLRGVGALGTLLAAASVAYAGSVTPPMHSNPQTLRQGRQMLAARHARFVENKGQWSSEARFFAKGKNVDVWYTERGLRFDQHFRKGRGFVGQAVDMTFVGGKAFLPQGQKVLRSSQDVIHGKHAVTGIRSFGETYARGVLPGVDLRGYYTQSTPRYDLIVSPGTNPRDVNVAFRGANGLSIASGSLKIGTKGGGILNSKPLAYQMVDGARRPVNARWAIRDARTAGFEIGAYDKSKPLVIDPLIFGTYYGGDNGFDEVRAAIGDGTGVIIVGTTNSSDFPALYGPYNNSFNPNGQDAFVARLTDNGANQDYAALIGGRGVDIAQYVKIDGNGDVWVAGTTTSNGTLASNYPATVVVNSAGSTNTSFFVTRFLRISNPGLGTPPLTPINLGTGAFFQSLVLGLDSNNGNPGQKFLSGFDLQPGSGGNAIGFAMSGVTTSAALSTTIVQNIVSPSNVPAARLTGHFFEGHRTGFLLRFYADATTGFFYGIGSNPNQYVEGSRINEARGVALDVQGNAYLVGTVYEGTPRNIDTGVAGNESFFETTPLVFQGVNNLYVTGRVQKATDVFLRKYSPSGNFRPTSGDAASLAGFSGLLGGGGTDEAGGIATTPTLDRVYTGSAVALGPGGDIYLTGTFVGSNDFPATPGAFQSNLTLNPNIFVTRIDNAGTQIKASTGLAVSSGGVGPTAASVYAPWSPLTVTPSGIAVDSRGLVFVTGNLRPNSVVFPDTPGDPNEPSSSTLSSISFPTDPVKRAALNIEDQTYASPTTPEFPTTEGFLTGLKADLSDLIAQTYIGGLADDFCFTPNIDPKTNEVFVIGWTDGYRSYTRANAAMTTFKTYTQVTGLPDGNGTPASDNLLSLPRIKVNAGVTGPNPPAQVPYGYGVWATPPGPTNNVAPALIGATIGRDGFVLRLSAVGTAIPSRLSSITFNPSAVPSGGSTMGTVTLTDVAPVGGTSVTISTASSNVYIASNPFTVVVAAGDLSAPFTVRAANVQANVDGTLPVVSFTGRTKQVDDTVTGSFTIQPLTYTLTLSPGSIAATGNSPVQGTITLPNTTPTDIVFNLTSSNPAVAAVPSSIPLRAGSSSVSFTFNPAQLPAGSSGTPVTITATVPALPRIPPVSAKLNVLPVQPIPLISITGNRNPIRSSTGGQVVYTVSFQQPTTTSTTVTISFSSPSVFSGSRTFTVPAGTTSFPAVFNVNRVSRSLDVTVSASANSSEVSTVTTVLR